jgi:hypothetical protein
MAGWCIVGQHTGLFQLAAQELAEEDEDAGAAGMLQRRVLDAAQPLVAQLEQAAPVPPLGILLEGQREVVRLLVLPDMLGVLVERVGRLARVVADTQGEVGAQPVEEVLLEEREGDLVGPRFGEDDDQDLVAHGHDPVTGKGRVSGQTAIMRRCN